MNHLPPMTSIRAFEAVARHLSFTRAAEELGMTQAAVSYQIKLLEERVGMPLFVRKTRQISLTDTGARLAPEVTQAFDILRSTFADTRDRADTTLGITTVPLFANHWLAQNLVQFQLAHPQLAVRIDSDVRIVDLLAEDFDVGIRGSRSIAPGLVGHRLVGADFSPLVSPALIAQFGPLDQPADLLKFPMVDATEPWAQVWFEQAGVAGYNGGEGRPAITLGSQTMQAAAAMAGHGVAFLTPAFYADDIAAGRLVQPFKLLASDGHSYWLVYPESRRNVPKIRAFRDWILPATAHMREE